MSQKRNITLVLFDIGSVIYEVDWKLSIDSLNLNIELKDAYEKIEHWETFYQFEKGNIDEFSFHKEINKRLNLNLDFDCFKKSWNLCLIGALGNSESLINSIKNCNIAALSNTNILHYNHFKNSPIFKDFKKILTSFDLHERKPDIAIYKKAIDILEIPPEQILFIDDLHENLKTAATFGINCEHCKDDSSRLKEILNKYDLID